MNVASRLSGFKQTVSTFWSERNQREQRMLLVAMAVIVLGLIYVVLLDPALSGRSDLEKRLPALRQQAAQVQALSKEASALSAKTVTSPPAITRESIESSLTRQGLKPQSVSLTGELAKVQLNDVSFASTIDWLVEMQRSARLSVIDAKIDAQAQADKVNATFTLRQQRTE
ncbi:MAG TPA: type II secretion system protein M [Noviherbaspirillum sp.]|nr:type II secretion system protein M [Noviherbaspirillum sp.]